jgi:hypothetical protein
VTNAMKAYLVGAGLALGLHVAGGRAGWGKVVDRAQALGGSGGGRSGWGGGGFRGGK